MRNFLAQNSQVKTTATGSQVDPPTFGFFGEGVVEVVVLAVAVAVVVDMGFS